MWLQTKIGFFSVVQKPEDMSVGALTVRARVRSDLEAFRALLGSQCEILATPAKDYRYRLRADAARVAAVVSQLVLGIDYGNFKKSVGAHQGKARASLYGEVWQTLLQLQRESARGFPTGEPNSEVPIPKAGTYGGVLFNGLGEVLLREPSNHFGGYVWTFAKGAPEHGETPAQAALREVREETGYAARIVGALPEAYAGSTSKSSAFFLMEPLGEPDEPGWETANVRWAAPHVAEQLISMTEVAEGRERDLAVLREAVSARSVARLGKGDHR